MPSNSLLKASQLLMFLKQYLFSLHLATSRSLTAKILLGDPQREAGQGSAALQAAASCQVHRNLHGNRSRRFPTSHDSRNKRSDGNENQDPVPIPSKLSLTRGFYLLPHFLPEPHGMISHSHFTVEKSESLGPRPQAVSTKHRGQRDLSSLLEDATAPSSVAWDCNCILRNVKRILLWARI